MSLYDDLDIDNEEKGGVAGRWQLQEIYKATEI